MQIQNAPIQALGAQVLREAKNRCVEAGLDIVCSLHDAVYVNAAIEDIEETKEKLLRLMADAFDSVFPGKTIGNEVKVVTSGNHYVDPRAIATLKRLRDKVPVLTKKITEILDNE
jgi:enamine deaminase RidA (YjgF/YER057c/UK114 family)